MGLVLQLLVSSLVMLALSKIIPGFEIKDFKTAILVALIFGICMIFGILLTKPFSFLASILASIVSYIPFIGESIAKLGLKLVEFLLKFIIGSIMLCITDKFISGFKMRSFAVGIVAAFIISLVGCFIPMF